MPQKTSDPTTPAPKRRNIRTSSLENRLEYLLENYPADIRQNGYVTFMEDGGVFWSKEQVLRAMEAAFKAGRRSRDKE